MNVFVHKTADVSKKAKIGKGTKIWHNVHIRENAVIGNNCIIGKCSYIDVGVKIGNNVKIQNFSSLYQGCKIEDGVFIGPYVCVSNDKVPRAINPNGSLKSGGKTVTKKGDWNIGKVIIKRGASIGAGSVILPDTEIGEWAMIGAGSIVTKNIPDYALAYGNPVKIIGYICKCGETKSKSKKIICKLCNTERK